MAVVEIYVYCVLALYLFMQLCFGCTMLQPCEQVYKLIHCSTVF